MQQIKQIEENHANAIGILGFFDDFGYSSKSLEKTIHGSLEIVGALFGTSASTPRRSHHYRHQISTTALTTAAASPRGSAFDRSLDLVMTGVAVASFPQRFHFGSS